MKKIFAAIIIFVSIVAGYFMEYEDNNDFSHIPLSASEIRVHFLDVGQGDSIFIELPQGKTMLIDAGENIYADDILKYIKSLEIDTIDYLVATHPHSDHIGGMLKIVHKMNINNIYMPKVSNNTQTFEKLLAEINNKNLTIKTAKAGVMIYSDSNTKVEIISPLRNSYEDINNYSTVIKLTYLNNSFLFMGDAEKLVEYDIIKEGISIDCDVLKVGHHGSNTSTGKDFINKVTPTYAVISCGVDNDYGHPHKQTLVTLINTNILRTDTDGTIVITSDGNNLKVEK